MERRWALIPVLAVSLVVSACAGSSGSTQGSAAQPTQVTATSGAPSEAAADALASTAAAPADDCTKIAAIADAYFSDGKARAAAEDLLALTTRMIKQADAKRARALYESATDVLPELLDIVPTPADFLYIDKTSCSEKVRNRYNAAATDLESELKEDIANGLSTYDNWSLKYFLENYVIGFTDALNGSSLDWTAEYSLRPMKNRLQEYLARSEP